MKVHGVTMSTKELKYKEIKMIKIDFLDFYGE